MLYFLILVKTKNEAKRIKEIINNFVNNSLNLDLNEKSRYYPSAMGVNFCGYRIFRTHKLLRTSSKIRIKRKISKWNKLWNHKNLNFTDSISSINSWYGHIKHCNSYNLKQKIINGCNFLYSNQTDYNSDNYIYDLYNSNI